MFKSLVFVFFGAIVSTVSFAGQYQCIYNGSPDGVRFGYRWTCNQSAPTQSEAERSCYRALLQNNLIVNLVGCSQTGQETVEAEVDSNSIFESMSAGNYYKCAKAKNLCTGHCQKYDPTITCNNNCYYDFKICMGE